MVQAKFIAHHKNDPPIDFVPPSGVMVHAVDNTIFAVLEDGMESGEPSVMILATSSEGHGLAMETSLDKFILAAQGLMTMAETQFNWTRPKGYASLVPEGPISEGRFHKHPDHENLLGEYCLDKICNKQHLYAIWREE